MELKNAKRGSCGAAEGAGKGVFTTGHSRNPSQGKYPPPPGHRYYSNKNHRTMTDITVVEFSLRTIKILTELLLYLEA